MTGPSTAMDSVPKPGGIPTGKERYIKGAALGEGTFGVVTKAEDTVTHKIVAIKKIRLGKYKEGVNFTAIREIKLLQELRHPHVIELVDCFPHKRNLNLVFECCESDLEAVIKDKFLPLGTPEIKSYMQLTLRAVAYCHETWVLHRDLKPNNLLIAPNGALKLADFGLARARRNTLVSGRSGFHGTPEWMAPEMLRAEDYDEKADSYSYGVVLWELLAAQTPWNELHPMQVVAVVGYSDRRLTLPPEAKDFAQENLVTRAIADLFWECASKTPRTRPGFDEILERLERAPGMLLPGPELKERTGTTQTSQFTLREDVPDAKRKNVAPKQTKAPADKSPGEASAASADGAAPLGARRVPAAGVEIEEITALEDAPSKRVSAVSAEMTTRGEEYVVHEDEEA